MENTGSSAEAIREGDLTRKGLLEKSFNGSIASNNDPVHALGLRMQITAKVVSSSGTYEANVSTGESSQRLTIAPKSDGRGSSVNGGEFLMLALATCYCNDLDREAQRLGVSIESSEVEASAEFLGIGLAATNITYRAHIRSTAGRRRSPAAHARNRRGSRSSRHDPRGRPDPLNGSADGAAAGGRCRSSRRG